jgi:hypothetical protein
MSTILKFAAFATLVAALAAPAAASAQSTHARSASAKATLHHVKARIPANAFGAAVGAPPSAMVISPQGQVLGTDPDLNVRFELGRDWIRGR